MKTAKIPVFSIATLLSVLEDEGICADELLSDIGLTGEELSDPKKLITPNQEIYVQTKFTKITSNRRYLWARAGKYYRILSYGNWGQMLATAPNIRKSFDLAGQTSEFDYTLAGIYYLKSKGDVIGMMIDFTEVPEDIRGFTVHRDVVAATNFLHDLWGGAFPLLRVELPELFTDDDGFSFCAPTTRGGQHAKWLWDKSVLSRPPAFANRQLHAAFAKNVAEATEMARRKDPLFLIDALAREHRVGDLELRTICDLMGLSKRSLQRRLREQGAAFRDIVNQARINAAKRQLLEGEQPIDLIAWSLGYSDVSSFHRAFKRATRVTPSEFRRNAV